MNAQTRQTLIGVAGLSIVMVVALQEGFNGNVLLAYLGTMIAILAPEALEDFGPWSK